MATYPNDYYQNIEKMTRAYEDYRMESHCTVLVKMKMILRETKTMSSLQHILYT